MAFIPFMLCERLTDPARLQDRRYIAKPKLHGQRAQLHIRQGRTVAFRWCTTCSPLCRVPGRKGCGRISYQNGMGSGGGSSQLEDWRFHDCRHHFAAWFMMRGGNLLALSKILGHSKVSMTEKYAHLAPDHLRRNRKNRAVLGTSFWNQGDAR